MATTATAASSTVKQRLRRAKVPLCIAVAVVLHLGLFLLPMLDADRGDERADRYAPVNLVDQPAPELPPPLREQLPPLPAPAKVANVEPRTPPPPRPRQREPQPEEPRAEAGGAESSADPASDEPPPPTVVTVTPTAPAPATTVPSPAQAASMLAYEADEERLLVDTVVYAVHGAQLEEQQRRDARASAAAAASGHGGPGSGMEEPAEWGINGRTAGLRTAMDPYCD